MSEDTDAMTFLGRGQHLQVPGGDLPSVLATCAPTEQLQEELELIYEDLLDAFRAEEVPPIDVGNRVNGEAWGWFRCYDFDGEDHWQLLPVNFQDVAAELITISATQELSRTGAFFRGGCRHVGGTAVSWFTYDEAGSWLDVNYDIDLASTTEHLCNALFDGEGDPLCPDADEHGWEVELDLAPELDLATVQRCLNILWTPCGNDPSHEQLDVLGQKWCWSGDGWSEQHVASGTATA